MMGFSASGAESCDYTEMVS